MRQVETWRMLVFDPPRHARGFFEALVTDNLDIGRPELIELVFRRGQRRGRPAAGQFKTKVVSYATDVNVNAFYRHSRIKQYLKDGRALRIETVINDPDDLGCHRRLVHLDELQSRARAVNTTLLDTERVGQGCVLASPAFERIARPTPPTTGTKRLPPNPHYHPQIYRRVPLTAQGSLKSKTTLKVLAPEVRYAAAGTWPGSGGPSGSTN